MTNPLIVSALRKNKWLTTKYTPFPSMHLCNSNITIVHRNGIYVI